MRTPDEVIASHLKLRLAGKVEEDIRTNFSPEAVIIDRHRVYRGHAGARQSAQILRDSLGHATFRYERIETCGSLGYLIWIGEGPDVHVRGIDSFVLEGGKITGQTIYYHT